MAPFLETEQLTLKTFATFQFYVNFKNERKRKRFKLRKALARLCLSVFVGVWVSVRVCVCGRVSVQPSKWQIKIKSASQSRASNFYDSPMYTKSSS